MSELPVADRGRETADKSPPWANGRCQRVGVRRARSAGWGAAGALLPVGLSPLTRAFLAVALLTVPVFAHGCHGDDVDHEPLLLPLRSNPEDR